MKSYNEIRESLADDLMKIKGAKVRGSVADQKAARDALVSKRKETNPPSLGSSSDKYKLGDYDKKSNRSYSEEVELEEILNNPAKRDSYISKADDSLVQMAKKRIEGKKVLKRVKGLTKAIDKRMNKEEVELSEGGWPDKGDSLKTTATITKNKDGSTTTTFPDGTWKIESKGYKAEKKPTNLVYTHSKSDIAYQNLVYKKGGADNYQLNKEEVEELEELSKKTLGSYVNKSRHDLYNKQIQYRNTGDMPERKKLQDKATKRGSSISKAVDKLTKEEVELDEMNIGKKQPRPDTHHIVDKENKPLSLAAYYDKAKAEKDRDEKHPGAKVITLGPRGKVKEEVELDEVLTQSTSTGTVVKDFQKSDAPQFKGKSKEKKQQMAVAAYLDIQRKKKLKEEVDLGEELDESERAEKKKSLVDMLNRMSKKAEENTKLQKNRVIKKPVLTPVYTKEEVEELEEADTYGWRTKKTPEGHKWEVHSFTYGKGEKVLHTGTEDSRAKAAARAKKHVMPYRTGSKVEESFELEEAKKEPMQVYHQSYSSAVQHAKAHAEKQGYTVHDDDWHDHVTVGPGRPSSGKTTRHVIPLHKDGKPSKKALAIQVHDRQTDKNSYELNSYIN